MKKMPAGDKKQSRREFLKKLGAGIIGAGGLGAVDNYQKIIGNEPWETPTEKAKREKEGANAAPKGASVLNNPLDVKEKMSEPLPDHGPLENPLG